MLLIYQKSDFLRGFYKTFPMETIEQISKKAESLTSAQLMGLKAMAVELCHKSNGRSLRFSSTDIDRYFRTAVGSDLNEKWYEIVVY
ncbi:MULTISPECIES: hypothetical protein [Bacillales]|uniref:Uncharacterized protein n=2 Tax=Bacillaceae TaxID=186817 RepID=A0A0V8JQN0_9BACI|nr:MULTISPECIES: hypothetical protein [Bacillaceae]KSU89212.1 hypothetical protein AS180_03530 [Priestia veravalensis]NMO75660.1 hypothetical protein [Niallia alba]SCB91848.1 hypothetical protein GA0061087_100430 [Priestia flexa]